MTEPTPATEPQPDDSVGGSAPARWWRARGKWSRRFLIGVPVAIALYTLFGFFGVSLVARHIVRPLVERSIVGTISVGRIESNPYTFRLRVEDLEVADQSGRKTIALDVVETNFEFWRSLFKSGWHFQHLDLDGPYLFSEIASDGSFNLAALVRPDPDGTESEPLGAIPHLVIDRLDVTNGLVRLDDFTLPEPFAIGVGGLTFSLVNLDTAPAVDNHHTLVATTDTGARLTWDGVFNTEPFMSKGTIVATDLMMPRFMPYLLRYTDARVVDGRLSASIAYDFAPLAEPRRASVNVSRIDLVDVKVEREKQSLASMPAMGIETVDIDAHGRTASIARITMHEGTLLLDRDLNGELNLARMLIMPAGALTAEEAEAIEAAARDAAAVGVTEAGPTVPVERVDPRTIPYPVRQLLTAISYLVQDVVGPWDIALEEVRIEKQSIDITDRGAGPGAVVSVPVRDLSLVAGPMRSGEGFVIPFTSTLRVGPDGQVSLGGSLGVRERVFESTIRAEGVELDPTSPYLALVLSPPLQSPTLQSAKVFVDARVIARTPDPNSGTYRWSGMVRFEDAVLQQSPEGGPTVDVMRAPFAELRGDASVALDSVTGQRYEWDGEIVLTEIVGTGALLEALALGTGSSMVERVAFDGQLVAERMLGDTAQLRWRGALEVSGAKSAELVIGGTSLATGFDAFGLDGTANLGLDADGGANANWEGTMTLDGSELALGGVSPVDGAAGAVRIEGRFESTKFADGGLAAEWNGDFTLKGLSGAVRDEEVPVRGEMGSSALRGAVTISHRDGASKVAFEGKLDAADVATAVETRSFPSDSRLANATLDGRFDGAVDAAGGWSAAWTGDAALAAAHSEVQAPRGAITSALEKAVVTGTTSVRSVEERAALRFDGGAKLDGVALDAADLSGPISLTTSTVELRGIASLHEQVSGSLAWEGSLVLDGIEGSADQLAGGMNATLTRLGVDGKFASEQREGEGSTLSWRGEARAEGSSVDFAMVGDGPLALDSEGLVTTVELSALLSPEGAEISWSGPLDLTNASLSSAALGIAGGAAALVVNGAGSAQAHSGTQLEWTGSLRGSAMTAELDAEGTTRSGTLAAVQFDGTVTSNAPEGGTAQSTVVGDFGVEDGSLVLTDDGLLTATVGAFRAQGLEFIQSPLSIAIKETSVTRPALVGEVSMVARTTPAAEPEETTARVAGEQRNLMGLIPFALRLDTVRVVEGRVDVIDRSGSAPSTVAADAITLSASSIANDGATVGELTASARLQNSGQLDVRGSFDGFRESPVADLLITLQGVPLPPYSGISGRYAGYQISEGRLTTTLPITIVDGNVTGDLEFLFDRLKLGAKVDSPDAPKIPLELGLSLLRDPNDQIRGEVPIKGRLDDPEFSFNALIWRALLGLIGKIVTAPFQLIASAFAQGTELDLSFIAYPTGSDRIPVEVLSKVDILAKGLKERPNVSLIIRGHYHYDGDVAALRPTLLKEELLTRLRTSFPQMGEIPPDVYRQLVVTTYAQKVAPTLPPPSPGAPPAPSPTFEQMEIAVLETIEVPELMLEELAQRRAEIVARILVEEQGVPAARVIVEVPPEDELEGGTHVDFDLR